LLRQAEKDVEGGVLTARPSSSMVVVRSENMIFAIFARVTDIVRIWILLIDSTGSARRKIVEEWNRFQAAFGGGKDAAGHAHDERDSAL
jgi:hypothetical protein